MEKYLFAEDFRVAEILRNHTVESFANLARVKNEFANSILNLQERIDAADTDAIETIAGNDNWNYNITVVSLNYTNTLERIKTEDQVANLPLLFPHGRLDLRRQINFGVAHLRQINNYGFQQRSMYCDPWTKDGQNRLYGNRALEETYEVFRRANLIVTFGVSFGETDSHLWNAISEEMTKRDNLSILCFDYNLPEKNEGLYYYSIRAEELKKRLRKKLQLADSERNNARIFVYNSSRVFRFSQPFSA